MLPDVKFNPQDYEQNREDEPVTYHVGDVPVMAVRDRRSFWDNCGFVDSRGLPRDTLKCSGQVTIANPDRDAQISAIHIVLAMDVVFSNGQQFLRDGKFSDILAVPRDGSTLTEQANGAFRDVIDRQVPHAAYKNLDPEHWNQALGWNWTHRKMLASSGIETGKYGLVIARFQQLDEKCFVPIGELCDADALSRDPVLRGVVRKLIESFFRRDARNLPGMASAFLPAPGQ